MNIIFFEESQKLKNLCRKLIKFYNHISHDMEMCMGFFQSYKEIQNGHHAWTFFGGRKNSKIEVRNNVQVILLIFKMATTSRLFKYLWLQKTLTQFMAGDDIGLQSSCYDFRPGHVLLNDFRWFICQFPTRPNCIAILQALFSSKGN